MHVLSKGLTVDDKLQIQPGTAQETLIIPLYARKKCGDKFPELYADPAATEICNRLDYDFQNSIRNMTQRSMNLAHLKVPCDSST